MDKIQIVISITSIAIILAVLDLVRRKKIKESYSFLWLATGIFMLVTSLSRKLLDIIAAILGIYYPPSALFLIGIIFLILLLLQFSVVISGLSENNKKLAQKISLLEFEINELRKRNDV